MPVELLLVIVNVPAASALAAGQRFLVDRPVVLGRASSAELHLPDTTVSRTHARLVPEPTPRGETRWVVHNISSGNGVFVDGSAVPPGTSRALGPAVGSLQVGGIVLSVQRLEQTRPVTEPITTEESVSASAPILTVVRDGDGCTVHAADRYIAMRPASALVLWALASSPGAVVHEWDILDAIGRAELNLPQAVSGVRRALRDALASGALSLGPLRSAMRQVITGDALAELDALAEADLLRRLVVARRGHGYMLLLPAWAVVTESAG